MLTVLRVHGVGTRIVRVVFWRQVTVSTDDRDCRALTGGTARATADRVCHSARLHQHRTCSRRRARPPVALSWCRACVEGRRNGLAVPVAGDTMEPRTKSYDGVRPRQ